jgi:hypothetical protein
VRFGKVFPDLIPEGAVPEQKLQRTSDLGCGAAVAQGSVRRPLAAI